MINTPANRLIHKESPALAELGHAELKLMAHVSVGSEILHDGYYQICHHGATPAPASSKMRFFAYQSIRNISDLTGTFHT